MSSKQQTPDQIRIAIAESHGWVKVRQHWEKDGQMAFCDGSVHHLQLPDYPNSRDAIQEVIAGLNPTSRVVYLGNLYCVVDTGGSSIDVMDDDWKIHTATALQCCEAYLRTFSKWID